MKDNSLPIQKAPLPAVYILLFYFLVKGGGKPVPFAEIEVEFLNHQPDMKANAFIASRIFPSSANIRPWPGCWPLIDGECVAVDESIVKANANNFRLIKIEEIEFLQNLILNYGMDKCKNSVAGFRSDADLLVWWLSDDPEKLQDANHRLRASAIGR